MLTDEIAKEQAREQMICGESPSSFMCKSTDGEGVSYAYVIKVDEGFYIWPKTYKCEDFSFAHFEAGMFAENIPQDWLRMYF